MPALPKPESLFARTAVTLLIPLLLLSVVILATSIHFAMLPMARRSADDLAALLVLSAKTWAELPPVTRPDFIDELQKAHDIRLRTGTLRLEPLHELPLYVYLRVLEAALSRRLEQPDALSIGQDAEQPGWVWIQLPAVDQPLQFGIHEDRIGARPPLIFGIALLAVFLVSIGVALIIARRITRPLERLSAATGALGEGRHQLLPEEKGDARELRQLIGNFNEMARQVRALLENRTTLLAGISHDLRTPLTRLRLALEIHADGLDPRLRASLDRNLAEMEALLEQSMMLARGIDGNEAREPTDLVDFLRTLAAQMEAEWIQRHPDRIPTVRFLVAEEVGPAWHWSLPRQSCLRVLRNLVENALRYGGNGAVELRLERMGNCPLIRVLDRGPGIPESHHEAVFRPFYRLDSSRNPGTGGSGLGLAIVQQLCQALGWRVELSLRDGGGTEVRLLLCASGRGFSGASDLRG